MERLLNHLVRHVSHFDTQEWLLAMFGAVLIGYFSLRGFSRR